MVRRTPLSRRRPRLAAAATVALSFVATCAATSTVYGAPRDPAFTTPRLGAPAAKASGASVNLASSSLKVVSSTGHKLRVRVFAFRSSTGTSIEVGVETRDLREQHAWTFKAPDSAVSLSAKGKGRIRLTSKRSGGFATISLRSSPVGRAVLSTCHKKTATKIRHVALSGTLRFKTRSDGKHAWGSVGSAHKAVHFSTKSKITWVKPAASNCPTADFPCRNTFLWQAESLPGGRARPRRLRQQGSARRDHRRPLRDAGPAFRSHPLRHRHPSAALTEPAHRQLRRQRDDASDLPRRNGDHVLSERDHADPALREGQEEDLRGVLASRRRQRGHPDPGPGPGLRRLLDGGHASGRVRPDQGQALGRPDGYAGLSVRPARMPTGGRVGWRSSPSWSVQAVVSRLPDLLILDRSHR